MNLYWNALKLKWFMIGMLISLSASLFLVFLVFPPSPNLAQLSLTILLTFIGLSFFYEWYLLPGNTKLGGYCDKIFERSYQRTRHLTPKEALRDTQILGITIAAIFIIGGIIWKLPEHTSLGKWAITFLSGIMGTYAFKEELESPKAYKQRYLHSIYILIFIIIIALVYCLSSLGARYSKENHEFPIFLVTAGSWLSIGIVGSTLKGLIQVWRDKSAATN